MASKTVISLSRLRSVLGVHSFFAEANNLYLKCYYDQNFMSRMKQKYVLYSLSDVAVPVLVTEMKFGPRKLKILSLENWCFRVRHYEFMFQ